MLILIFRFMVQVIKIKNKMSHCWRGEPPAMWKFYRLMQEDTYFLVGFDTITRAWSRRIFGDGRKLCFQHFNCVSVDTRLSGEPLSL